MSAVYRRQYKGSPSARMPAAEQSSPSVSGMRSNTESQSPSVTAKASFATDIINLARGSKFGFQECFDNCANLQKQLEGRTKNGKDMVELALRYANSQTHMIEECMTLLSSCQVHANLYQQENYNIHGDVKDMTNYTNQCLDLVKATLNIKIQHTDDVETLSKMTDSQQSETKLRTKSLIVEAKKKLILEDNFFEQLTTSGIEFVQKSIAETPLPSHQPKFLFDPVYNLFKMGQDLLRKTMTLQTPSSEHNNFLFKNILNLYEIEYAQFLMRHTFGLINNPSVCLSQELLKQIKTDAPNDEFDTFSKVLIENTLSKKQSKKIIESHEVSTISDSRINKKLTRLIVQGMAFATMFLRTDTASKSRDENIKQFEANLWKVLEDYLIMMKNLQKEKTVYYANNKQISAADIEKNIISHVTTRVTNQIELEYNIILEKILRNPDYNSWDLHFFTDEYVADIVNDEPDSADAANAKQDYEAESFMSHRVIDAIIAFDVIPNVLESKWTDVRGTPPIKNYPMPTSTDASNAGSRGSYHTCNNGDHIPWSQGSTFPGEEI